MAPLRTLGEMLGITVVAPFARQDNIFSFWDSECGGVSAFVNASREGAVS
jgi:hypothetical protein